MTTKERLERVLQILEDVERVGTISDIERDIVLGELREAYLELRFATKVECVEPKAETVAPVQPIADEPVDENEAESDEPEVEFEIIFNEDDDEDEDEDDDWDEDWDDEDWDDECEGDCDACDICGECEYCDDDEYFEIVCPSCGETVCFDESVNAEELLCPACGNALGTIVDDDEE